MREANLNGCYGQAWKVDKLMFDGWGYIAACGPVNAPKQVFFFHLVQLPNRQPTAFQLSIFPQSSLPDLDNTEKFRPNLFFGGVHFRFDSITDSEIGPILEATVQMLIDDEIEGDSCDDILDCFWKHLKVNRLLSGEPSA